MTASPSTFASVTASTFSLLTGVFDVLRANNSPLIGLGDGLGRGVSPLTGKDIFLGIITSTLPS